jgi:hypothetical protein
LAAHEDLSRGGEGLKVSSDRAFGLVFTVFFSVIGLWPLLRSGPVRTWAVGLAGGFLLLALMAPRVLNPLNRLWVKLAIVLNRIMNPVATGAIFFLAFVPMGILLRAMKKDLLRLSFDQAAKTYWIEREPPGPPPESMINQF